MKLRSGIAAGLAGAVVLAAGTGLVLVTPVQAAQSYPKALDRAIGAGVSVVKQFPAASGLTGWVLGQGGRYTIVYTTADGKTMLAGVLVDEQGENLAERYEEQYVPKPDFSAAWQQLEKTAYVTEGASRAPKSVVYIFVDANCPFCHLAWRAVQPYEAAGLQVRWIPVATLGPTSMPKAVEVLAASDKLTAFRRMEANHGKPWNSSPASDPVTHAAIATSIESNGKLMGAFGIGGTPGIVWRDRQGKVQVKGGMPRLSELPTITGLPEQKVDDPALAKFR
jgi:thiol:disulfide interchange protein DsbG